MQKHGSCEQKSEGICFVERDTCLIRGRLFLKLINVFFICPNDCLFEVICSDQVGNRKLLVESGISISTEVENFVVELEESAKTGILVACNGILIGVLGVADSLKREASVVVEGLQKMGITPVMVTGDNWRTARAVAKEVCIYFYNILFLVGNSLVITLSAVQGYILLSLCFNIWAFTSTLKTNIFCMEHGTVIVC